MSTMKTTFPGTTGHFTCAIYTQPATDGMIHSEVPSGRGVILLRHKTIANARREITRRFGCIRGFNIVEAAQ